MGNEPHGQIREIPPVLREPQATATHEARDANWMWEQVWERPWIGFALSATLPGIILSLIGPFGSFGAPLWMRFAYWMPTMALGASIGAAISILFETSPFFKHRPILRTIGFTTSMTAAMTGVAWGMGQIVFGPDAVRFGVVFVFYVWVITIIVSVISSIIRARRTIRVEVATAAVPTVPAPTSLVARLPAKLKTATILALQGEDHYVRVHTDAGSDLILIRLTDAVAEMGSTPGARTHRSWWVAKTAVKSVRRTNGRVALVLANDAEVPISRGYASELREAGWLTEPN